MKSRFPAARKTQHGAVLFVALVFLILLTLLGIAASSTSILQEKMTGSLRNRQLGLMGAESALRGGEAYLWNLAYNAAIARPMPPCVSGDTDVDCVYQIEGGRVSSLPQAFRTSKTWLPIANDGARTYTGAVSGLTGANETASIASQPRFMIEDMGPDVPAGAGRRGGSIQQEKVGAAGSHEWYRITARSQGGNDTVVRAAESVFSATTPNTYTPPTP